MKPKLFITDNIHEAIDIAERKLVEQGRHSAELHGACFYRTSDEQGELRCAIGHIMTPEAIEKLGTCPGGVRELVASAGSFGFDVGTMSIRDLQDLQGVHDFWPVDKWPARFANLRIMVAG